MKKTVFSIILGVSLFCPSAHAILIPLTEAQMKAVFGQAGISIEIQNLDFEYRFETFPYTDEDGSDGTAGSVYIGEQYTHKIYKALYTAEDFAREFKTATISDAHPEGLTPLATWSKASPLSIDTGACLILTEIQRNGEAPEVTGEKPTDIVRGVVFGLPTLIVNTSREEFSIGASMAGAVNDNKEFLRIKIEGNAVFILGGTAEIAAR
jgi:hypothetical protein